MTESHRTGSGAADDSYTYDRRNRLVAATVGGSTLGYTHTATGARTSETVNGAATYYVNDDQNPTSYSQVSEEKTTAGDSTAPTIPVCPANPSRNHGILGAAGGQIRVVEALQRSWITWTHPRFSRISPASAKAPRGASLTN